MKKMLGTAAACLIAVLTYAQITVKGKISASNGLALSNATVTLKSNARRDMTQITGIDGNFIFKNVSANAAYTIKVQFVGKKTSSRVFVASANKTLDFILEDMELFLEPLEIRSIRASERAPFTKTNISKAEIEKMNLGQDIPFLLNQTPSVTVTSDAGNGIGYTGIRIRGSDASRVNVTLNGIPYNDAESQGTFFVNLPDFASSVNSIQIQRGAGTSTNGAGAFGATVNLGTNEFNDKAYAEINSSYGSFRTWKNTVKAGSGLLNEHFTIDARLSRINSDGYIDRAFSKLQSFYLSGAYINKKTSVRLNVFSGKEKTYQAWYGLPENLLQENRTYNAAGTERPGEPYHNQTDNYQQDHYQLFVNHAINSHWNFSLATFLTRGKGFYEEYKAQQDYEKYGLDNFITGNDTLFATDLIRQRWLDNYFYGQVFSVNYKKVKDELSIGGSWTDYAGKHIGYITWAKAGVPDQYQYYLRPALKTDRNIYVKWAHLFNNAWSIFADVQYRHVFHKIDGFSSNPGLFIKRNFVFFNPKAGVSYKANGVHAYFSYAVAGREPNRDDFEAAITEQPKKEIMHDFEIGISKKTSVYNWGATWYYMLYKDQLVLTGKINDVGAYTRTNAANSYRAGIELQGGIFITGWLSTSANFTWSLNKIASFAEYIDDYDTYKQQVIRHANTDIAFSPSFIGSGFITILPVNNLEISLVSKYVGRQYLDNTQNSNRMLHGFFNEDVRASYQINGRLFGKCTLSFQVNNFFNSSYEANGYTYPYIYDRAVINDNYYYPMAGINYLIALNVKF